MTKHTPGPWYIRFCDDDSFMNMTVISSIDWGDSNTSSFDNEPDTVAIVFHQLIPLVSCDLDDNGDANARLIAAAPDMLEALENLVDKYNAMQDGNISAQLTNGDFFAARAAIAKAKGQSV